MDSAITVLTDTLSHALRKKVLAGAIVVLHPFGKHLGFNLHLHLLVTEGGFDRSKKFIHKKYLPFRALRRTWQYQVLTNLKNALPKTKENAKLIDRMFEDYLEGFYLYTRTRREQNNVTAEDLPVCRTVREASGNSQQSNMWLQRKGSHVLVY